MLCLPLTALLAAGGEFHTTKAKDGEGVFALLRRFHLSSYACNVERFYDINKMKPNAPLIKGKKYNLPVKIYKYNGISIRSTIGIDDWEQAVRIKQFNEAIHQLGVRKTSYLDSKILWVPYHLMECVPAKSVDKKAKKTSSKKNLKSFGKKRYDELFGDKHAHFRVEDQKLKGQVYYVVSGHGGPDPGACCAKGHATLCEDEYAYDVALRLYRNLLQHGATAYMIIQDDDGIRDEEILKCDKKEKCMGIHKIPLNQKKRLHQRAAAINKLYKKHKKQGAKVQKAIMIHIDSRAESKRQDVFFYHWGPSKSSKKLAYNLQNTFQKKYDYYQKGRGYKGYVSERGLYMLRNTLPTAVFAELANIRNVNDHERILRESNRQALANWLFEGMTGLR